MTKQQKFQSSPVSFYATPPHNCSYLPSEEATTVFVDPNAPVKDELYNGLTRLGFRRSGEHIYRPQCKQCNQCIAVRIPVKNFKPSRSQKRLMKKNQDLSVKLVEGRYSDEHYALYENYINEVHADGDMFPASKEQYQKFLLSDWSKTYFIELREGQKLIAVGVIDKLDDGFSAVYTFYDPLQQKRSLGTHMIVQELFTLAEQGLDYLYLGYYIKNCDKMNYKTRFKPIEYLINNQWIHLN